MPLKLRRVDCGLFMQLINIWNSNSANLSSRELFSIKYDEVSVKNFLKEKSNRTPGCVVYPGCKQLHSQRRF